MGDGRKPYFVAFRAKDNGLGEPPCWPADFLTLPLGKRGPAPRLKLDDGTEVPGHAPPPPRTVTIHRRTEVYGEAREDTQAYAGSFVELDAAELAYLRGAIERRIVRFRYSLNKLLQRRTAFRAEVWDTTIAFYEPDRDDEPLADYILLREVAGVRMDDPTLPAQAVLAAAAPAVPDAEVEAAREQAHADEAEKRSRKRAPTF